MHLFRSLGASRYLLFLSILFSVGGCTSDGDKKISPDKRTKITKVTVTESHPEFSAKLSGSLPENAGSGLAGGAAAGFFGGLFVPTMWLYGGPILATPILAASLAACGKAVAEVNEPSVQLQNIASDADAEVFQRKLESELKKITMQRQSRKAAASMETGLEVILEISLIEIVMEGAPPKEGLEGCLPRLHVSSKWKVMNAIDGQELEKGETVCSHVGASSKTFRKWFEDHAQAQAEIRESLKKVAGQTARDLLLKDNYSRCY